MMRGTSSVSRWSRVCLVVAALLAAAPAALAACGNNVVEAGEQCDDGSSQNGGANSCCTASCQFSGEEPDVIVGMLYGSTSTGGTLTHWGNSGGITAYSMGTKSCNVGSCWLNWVSNTSEHPVIGQNMYRLKNGRFEHIGQSWLKHGFTALTQNLCGTCIAPPNGSHLGVSCSDPYSANLNGDQSRLGPKWQVNPSTGVFPYPFGAGSGSGALYKRLQVRNGYLDPAVNAGALYFVEGQYVTRDDSAAGNQDNNASYRRATVTGSGTFTVTLQDSTVQGSPAIKAWKATDPSVSEVTFSAGDGLFILSAKATDLGGGVYHYEYALQNLNSDRAGQSFSVPIPPGTVVTNVGFHDVSYHSGEPFVGLDWPATISSTSVSWATQTFATNQNANALRWGTLYNFRFDANVAPGSAEITLGLFKPGSPASVSAATVVPGGCTGVVDGTSCIDGDACTQTDTCQSGVCTGSNPVVCAPSDQCHDAGTCASGTGICSNPEKPDGSTCADGDGCTQTDTCQAGVCAGSNPVICTASDACHQAGACNPGTGLCSNPEEPDGTGCDDSDACTEVDTCQTGVCTGASPVVCTASDSCHTVGTCDPETALCSNPEEPDGIPCDDANSCTEDDLCSAGVCAGTGDAVPEEVGDVAVSQSEGLTTIAWSPALGATRYDVLLGLVSGLPVGPGGGDEVCLGDDEVGSFVTHAADPDPGESFWYLVAGENDCGRGSYGSGRESATCP